MCAAALALACSAGPPADTPELRATSESGSLIASRDGAHLFAASFDAGTVAMIDAATGERLAELAVGRDVQRIALGPDERVLAATDMLDGTLTLIDVPAFRVREVVKLAGRPFGVVYAPASKAFWVALCEAAELVAVDLRGRVVERIATRDTPRGLAVTDDQRLLVTHAMIGEVSVYALGAGPPRHVRTIALADTEDPDPFVSQGRPRLLDDIAVSPDGSEAWLPHVLWSFGHPFQFRSTVFPAISVLSLDRGTERELIDRRKELFRQIDVRDSASKTRIVSNPHDVAFSGDGTKAYVTLSGSEDLAVFDLSRRAATNVARRSRRRGKQPQGGAKAVQILRDVPAGVPRGLVVVNDALFVQSGLDFTLAKLSRGGDGPFARVSVVEPIAARPVASDPRTPELRRGREIFMSASSDRFPEHPLAGDFWMSCASCHQDGFNFTNRYLMRDAQRHAVGKPGGAIAGHAGLRTMVAGDFVGDYIRMIQDTQGGMGADERMGLPRVDPERPPAPVVRMMEDLHVYVTAPENLPHLSTWLRVSHAEKLVPAEAWIDPARCGECHGAIYDQWRVSNHRLMSSSHPYYRVLEDLAAEEEGEAFRGWCMGCHNPKHLLAGRTATRASGETYAAGHGSLLRTGERGGEALDEGTDCLFCHRVSAVEHAGGNASLTVDLASRPVYPFETSAFSGLRWLGSRLIDSRPSVHAASYSSDAYDDPKYCGSCHSEFAPGSGAVISDTYAEWASSPFNAPENPSQHRTCVDCHMHADVSRIGEPIAGTSTDGGRTKENVRTHGFAGANVDFVALRSADAAAQSLALLRRAAEVAVALDAGTLRVRVRNVGAGHHLPTGVADLRQLWLHVRAVDARGRIVVRSGELTAGGALRDDARIFNKVLGDAEGRPVGLRFWRYATLLSDTRIPAGAHRDERFALPDDVAFPLAVEVELRFRIFPHEVTERVRAVYPDLPSPAVHTLARRVDELRGP